MTEEKKIEETKIKSDEKVEMSVSSAGKSEIKVGMLIRVHQKIKELDAKGKSKERVQVFEGLVIARHGGNETGATFTVRKVATGGVGVEKIYPFALPSILKIEIVKEHKVRSAKLYYLRGKYKKKLKEIKKV